MHLHSFDRINQSGYYLKVDIAKFHFGIENMKIKETLSSAYRKGYFCYVCIHPSHQTAIGHYRPSCETPFEWRLAGGPIVASLYILTGIRRSINPWHYSLFCDSQHKNVYR